MTRPDLEAIKARAEAATAGPWEVAVEAGDEWWFGSGDQVVIRVAGPEADYAQESIAVMDESHEADLRFAAAARADVPTLLAYIAELEAEANMWANR